MLSLFISKNRFGFGLCTSHVCLFTVLEHKNTGECFRRNFTKAVCTKPQSRTQLLKMFGQKRSKFRCKVRDEHRTAFQLLVVDFRFSLSFVRSFFCAVFSHKASLLGSKMKYTINSSYVHMNHWNGLGQDKVCNFSWTKTPFGYQLNWKSKRQPSLIKKVKLHIPEAKHVSSISQKKEKKQKPKNTKAIRVKNRGFVSCNVANSHRTPKFHKQLTSRVKFALSSQRFWVCRTEWPHGCSHR